MRRYLEELMCRAKNTDGTGGRRCNQHNAYGRKLTLLQAQKQYTARKLKAGILSEKQREKLEQKLASTTKQVAELKTEKTELGTGLHPYSMNLSPETEKVLNAIYDAGFHPYIVGGSVRDALLNLPQKDIDIEVYGGDAEDFIKAIKPLGKVDEVGKSFGVIKLQIGKEDFDISLPRKERKTGDGHRAFDIEPDPFMSLDDATARRDYTINALMYDHRLGFIVDKHGGYEDLENKILRHVSDAFDEDPLRVLRGVQMSSRFGFTLHPDTITKAQSLLNEYSTLAVERVQIEFQKLYEKGKSTQNALQVLQQTGWDKHFVGLSENNTPELWDKVANTQELLKDKGIAQEKNPAYLGGVIASHLPEPTRKEFLSTTMVGDDQKNMAYHLATITPPEVIADTTLRHWAYEIPRQVTIRDILFVMEARGETDKAQELFMHADSLGLLDSRESDWVNGNDVLTLFPAKKPGKWLGGFLDSIREAQYSRQFVDTESGIQWAKQNANLIND